jgi:hypothetical protein
MTLADSASSAIQCNMLFTITTSFVTHGMACHQDAETDFHLNTWAMLVIFRTTEMVHAMFCTDLSR